MRLAALVLFASAACSQDLPPRPDLDVIHAGSEPIGPDRVLLVDVSGSMICGGDFDRAVFAAVGLAAQATDHMRVACMAFNDAVFRWRAAKLVDMPDAQACKELLGWLTMQRPATTGAGTNIHAGLEAALKAHDKATVIVVTDGVMGQPEVPKDRTVALVIVGKLDSEHLFEWARENCRGGVYRLKESPK